MRFISQLIIFPIYWAASLPSPSVGALALFTLNTVLVLGSFAVFISAVLRIFFPQIAISTLRLVGCALLWPFSIDLLFFPSLQEKIIILAAGFVLRAIDLSFKNVNRKFLQILLILSALLSFASKTHFVLFVPILVSALMILRVREMALEAGIPRGWRVVVRQSWRYFSARIVIWLTLIALGSTVVIAGALLGEYSSSTRGSPGSFRTMLDWRFHLVSLAFLAHMGASLYLRIAPKRSARFRPEWILSALFGVSVYVPFMVAFFAWEIRNYYLSLLAPVFAITLNLCLVALSSLPYQRIERLKAGGQLLVTGLCIAWVFFRLPMGYGATNSFKEFAVSQIRQKDDVVFVMCGEAQIHFNYYVSLLGFDGPKFVWVGERGQYAPADGGLQFEVLADEMFCPLERFPLPADVESGELLWTASSRNSYQLWAFSALADEDR